MESSEESIVAMGNTLCWESPRRCGKSAGQSLFGKSRNREFMFANPSGWPDKDVREIQLFKAAVPTPSQGIVRVNLAVA